MKLFLAPIVALVLLLAAPSAGRAQTEGIEITPDIAVALDGIAAYMEDIKTLQSDFLQISSTGDTAEGTIELKRPKHLRIDYKPPTPIVIIASGDTLSYADTELQQVNRVPLEDTPAGFLLRDKFDFKDGGLTVTGFEKGAGVIRLSVVQSKDPLAGELTLAFTADPMSLRKWTIVDAQNIVTTVTLINPRFDYPIPDARFIADFPMFDLNK